MENESERRIDPAEEKDHLEALAGHDIDVSAEQFLHLLVPVGMYDYTDGQPGGQDVVAARWVCRVQKPSRLSWRPSRLVEEAESGPNPPRSA